MGNHRNRFPARRRFLKQSAALSAGAVAVGAPLLALGQARAEPDPASRTDDASNAAPAVTARSATQTGASAAPVQSAARPAAPPARPPRRRVAG